MGEEVGEAMGGFAQQMMQNKNQGPLFLPKQLLYSMKRLHNK